MSCIHIPYIHTILYIYITYTYVVFWVFGILGETYTTNKIKTTKQKPTSQKIFSQNFSLNENDYHLQSN